MAPSSGLHVTVCFKKIKLFKDRKDRECFRLTSNFLILSLEIIFVAKFCSDMTRGLNYLQNEAGVAKLDDAREKAAEVMKRLLHTQKVSTAALHCTWFPICV
jgi:hypothetical protein